MSPNIFTLLLGLALWTYVCGPLNHRPLPDKLFLLFVGCSLVGAWLRKLAQTYAYVDADGSVLVLAEAIIYGFRFLAIAAFSWIAYGYVVRCRARHARLKVQSQGILALNK